MGRPKLDLVQVSFRLTRGQLLDLKDIADKLGMTVPAYVKMMTLMDIKRDKVDAKLQTA